MERSDANPLDRPVWNMLTGRQAHLAEGDARAVRIDRGYGVFGVAADTGRDAQAALAALIPAGDALWIVEVWADQDAHAASLKLPSVQAAIARGRPLIAGFGQRFEFKPLSGSAG